MNGRPESAIPVLERCILLSPQDGQLNFRRGHLGQAYFQLGRYDEAFYHVLGALELKSEYGFTYLVAAIHGMMGDFEEGNVWLKRASERFPETSVEALEGFLSPSLYALHLEGIARLSEKQEQNE